MKNLKRRTGIFSVLISLLLVCLPSAICSAAIAGALHADTADIQVLYNGRAWRNLLYRIQGDQLLFNSGFIQGSVTIRGTTKAPESIRPVIDYYNSLQQSIPE